MSYWCREINTALNPSCSICDPCMDHILDWIRSYICCCFCCFDDSNYEFLKDTPPTACDRITNICCCCIVDDQTQDPLFSREEYVTSDG